jgi:hypothetical protein
LGRLETTTGLKEFKAPASRVLSFEGSHKS